MYIDMPIEERVPCQDYSVYMDYSASQGDYIQTEEHDGFFTPDVTDELYLSQGKCSNTFYASSSTQDSFSELPMLTKNEQLNNLTSGHNFSHSHGSSDSRGNRFYDSLPASKNEALEVIHSEPEPDFSNTRMSSTFDQLQHMENIVMEEIRKDKEQTCLTLDIPREPLSWTVEHVQRWVSATLHRYRLPTNDVEYFQLNGVSFSMLREEDFVARSRTCGSTLYAQLEVWRNASSLSDIKKESTTGPWSTWQYSDYLPMSQPMLSPNPSESSLDSTFSTESEFVIEDSPIPSTEKPVRTKQTIHLWQFLKELLFTPGMSDCIHWINRQAGVFRINDSTKVAHLWGKRKNRPAMNYDKLSRSVRQYYKKGIIKKTEHSKRLVYQFCEPYL